MMVPDAEPIRQFAGRMKSDWNERAIENAEYFIASTEFSSEEQFCQSGERDVAMLFRGLEYLIHPEQRVLDLGCGIGRMDQVLAPMVRSIVGVDVSSEMVARASERLAAFTNASFVEVSGCDLGPIPDNAITLLFSHIVFQHIPKSVVLAYITDAYRVLAPGGHLVFQVPERLADSPPDPADDDTFGMRYYTEEEIRYLMDLMGYVDLGFARLAATDADSVNHLRVTARTKSVMEKIADITDPTDTELEEWAYTWSPISPDNWLATIAQPERTHQFLKFAADPNCPQRDYFLGALYRFAAFAIESESETNLDLLRSLVDRAENHHGHPWVTAWADDVHTLQSQSTPELSGWRDSSLARQRVLALLDAKDGGLTQRIESLLRKLSQQLDLQVPHDSESLLSMFPETYSPNSLMTKVHSSCPTLATTFLCWQMWFSWRAAIAEAG